MGNLYPHGSPTGAMTEHSPETTTESKGLIRQTGWAKMRASSYQFMVPYVSDSTKTERELGITATQWNEALVATAESYRNKK
jgi:hypothetical protein